MADGIPDGITRDDVVRAIMDFDAEVQRTEGTPDRQTVMAANL